MKGKGGEGTERGAKEGEIREGKGRARKGCERK